MQISIKNVDINTNHQAMIGTVVIKRVVITAKGHPRDVCGIDYWNGEGTKQQAYPGDIIVTTKWEGGKFVSSGHRVLDAYTRGFDITEEDFNPRPEPVKEVKGIKLSKEIFDWLHTPVTAAAGSRCLPAGIGWDGHMTNSQASRYYRTRRLFDACDDPVWVERVARAAAFTLAAVVGFSPTQTQLPKFFNANDERPNSANLRRNNPKPEIWYYCIRRDGSSKLFQPVPGVFTPISEEFCSVIKIYLNAFCGYNGLFGAQWTYYSRTSAPHLKEEAA